MIVKKPNGREQKVEFDRAFIGNIQAIKAEIARLQKVLDDATHELAATAATQPVNNPEMELVAGTSAFMAAQAIRAAGKPLHVRDLMRAFAEQGKTVKEVTLVASLSRWVKRKSVFYRAARNTFGLLR